MLIHGQRRAGERPQQSEKPPAMEFLDAHLDNEPGTMPVLSYHAAREEAEDKARKAERMNDLEQEVPCQQSRVRSYTAKLDAIAGM